MQLELVNMLRMGQLSALWNVAHETNLTFNLVREYRSSWLARSSHIRHDRQCGICLGPTSYICSAMPAAVGLWQQQQQPLRTVA